MRTLGLDLGGVVIDTPTRISLPANEVPLDFVKRLLSEAQPTAPLSVARQIISKFDHVWIVSASDPEYEQLARQWLERWDFWGETGLQSDRLRFCATSSTAKAQLVRGLAPLPTDFLDDRWDYLCHMQDFVPNRVLYDRGEGEPNPDNLPRVTSLEEYLVRF